MAKYAVEFNLCGTIGVVVESDNENTAQKKAETLLKERLNKNDPKGIIDDFIITNWIKLEDYLEDK